MRLVSDEDYWFDDSEQRLTRLIEGEFRTDHGEVVV